MDKANRLIIIGSTIDFVFDIGIKLIFAAACIKYLYE